MQEKIQMCTYAQQETNKKYAQKNITDTQIKNTFAAAFTLYCTPDLVC